MDSYLEKRNFAQDDFMHLIELSAECGENILPYVNEDNLSCAYLISKNITTVKKYNITPEIYWNGNENDYSALITLLSSAYPSPNFLLETAKFKSVGEVANILDVMCHRVELMFNLHGRYKGYVILKPSSYMKMIYPSLQNKLYIYTSDVWTNADMSTVDMEPFIVVDITDENKIPCLISKKVNSGVIV